MNEENKKIINEIYKDPSNPYSFSSVENLYKYAKQRIPSLTLSQVKDFLLSQKPYTLFGDFKKKYLKRAVYVSRPGNYLMSDLADLSNLSEHNSGVKYLVIVQDLFSRFLQIYPIENKKSENVARSIEQFLEGQSHYSYNYLWTDEGK